ncbi:MAG TPA: UDP-3-O-acyl-N-acetylglucosamine deacetylase [Alphaproteobacteria bacterium]|nr:UDP-3-O-acyl-N-acetylglucosamine deacetylase [Alphaproteobacteria bacterium]
MHCSGIGLHSGKQVRMSLVPAPAGTGIRFCRTDLPPQEAWIDARWDRVTDTTLCTVISNQHGAFVGTVEHLMAALSACGLDNAVVELDAPEPPAMDGSAAPYMFLIECAGIATLPTRRQVLRILKPVRVGEGGKYAALKPSAYPELDVTIEFPNRLIGRQRTRIALSGTRFKTDLARARTFGFADEVDRLRSKGLAQGGSLDNAVVLDGETVLNPEGLRYPDEFVRHKALDVIGDLYLAGGPFLGRYVGNMAGHKLNNLLLRALFADRTAYEWADSLPVVSHADRQLARAAS